MTKLSLEFSSLKFNLKDNIAFVFIDNPPANALNSNTIEELSICIDHISDETESKAVVITGEGKFFVAGADIKEFQTAFGDQTKGESMARKAQELFDKIENLNIPVIAAINGACLGGGMELAMSCHLRIASEKAVLGQPELNLGLIPGFGGTQRLPRLTNKAKALEIILTSQNINGSEAEQLGLVNKAVPAEEVYSEAEKWAETIANQKSSVSVAAALNAVTKGLNGTLQEGLTHEAKLFGEMFGTSDMQEGVTAFIEKRKPVFKDC